MQILKTPRGPAIRVGLEERGKGPEHHLILAYDGIVRHRWYSELPDEFELIHDPGARAEADIALKEANCLIMEKEVLLECLSAALAMLDDRAAESVRELWRGATKEGRE